MSKTKQFFAILIFTQWMNPVVWFMTLAIASPYLIYWFNGGYTPSLNILLSNQSFFFVVFVGVSLMLPETFYARMKNQGLNVEPEYILTRAVDRYLVFRARSTLFYVVAITVPLLALLYALFHPDLRVDEYDKVSRAAIVARIPGVTTLREGYSNILLIPNGCILVAAWKALVTCLLVVLTQLLIVTLRKVRFGMIIIYVVIFAFIFGPLVIDFGRISNSSTQPLDPTKNAFLCFTEHPLLSVLSVAVAVIAGQFWCERRFQRMEF